MVSENGRVSREFLSFAANQPNLPAVDLLVVSAGVEFWRESKILTEIIVTYQKPTGGDTK